MKRLFFYPRVILGMVFFSVLTACDPVPVKQLSAEQKVADMMWLYSQFDENYAPLDYKIKKYSIDYEKSKSDFISFAKATKSNEEFYLLMNQFVAQFRDAHTSTSFSYGGLPGRAAISYLGISGKRKEDHFVVRELLPTFNTGKTHFPIQNGDEISHMDGEPLTQIIKKDLVPTEDLGQSESNLTYHMGRVFTRLSTSSFGTGRQNAVLKIVKRNYTNQEKLEIEQNEDRVVRDWEKKDVNIEVTVPWVTKDLFYFRTEQSQAVALKISSFSDEKKIETTVKSSLMNLADFFSISGNNGGVSSVLGLRGFDGSLKLPSSFFSKIVRGVNGYNYLNTFYFPNQVESWTSDLTLNENGIPLTGVTNQSIFKKVRYIPPHARFITSENATYPAYVASEVLHDRSGKTTDEQGRAYGNKLVATLFLNTFSPDAALENVLHEFKETLASLQFYGVKDLVIDMVNNGGGSLSLGLQLAQALSKSKIDVPMMQFRISETWLREFEDMTYNAPSDSEKELARRVYRQLFVDWKADKRLSRPISTESLIPFELSGNDQLQKPMNIVLLVNEMCASMCDIFAAIAQDNELAWIMGSETMGAGGNVVSHYQAPNSHLIVRQTESLMMRKDGSYLENNGVKPDYQVNVSLTSGRNYRGLRNFAIDFLTQIKEKKRFFQDGNSEGMESKRVKN